MWFLLKDEDEFSGDDDVMTKIGACCNSDKFDWTYFLKDVNAASSRVPFLLLETIVVWCNHREEVLLLTYLLPPDRSISLVFSFFFQLTLLLKSRSK